MNEAGELGTTLELVARNDATHELIVVDAQSQDRTAEIAAAGGAKVIMSAQRSRPRQMNAGAEAATGAVLLFLHADTRLRVTSLKQVQSALTNPRIVGGCFVRRFDSPSRFLKFTCRLADSRSRWLGWFFGDQAIFVRRSVFNRLGGFRELPAFEDLDFSRRLRRVGRVVALDPGIVSSARRFARRGPWVTTCSDVWRTLCYVTAGSLE